MSPPKWFRPVTRPDPGQAALEVLAISVHVHGCKTSSHAHMAMEAEDGCEKSSVQVHSRRG